MDLRTYDLAADLLAELVAALAHTRGGAVDQAVVHPGNQVPQYFGKCSTAAVRVVTILPVAGRSPICVTEWRVTYEMSVDRCYMTPADNGMPPVAVLDSEARDVLEDAGAMRKAALCAWPDAVRREVGTWTPRGPAGGAHGGAMQVTALGLGLSCRCDDEQWGAGIDSRVPPLPGDPRHP